jgi:hypothetical protein
MARAAATKFGGTSRVRFVMMEAEIADGGDLAQFTQAMQNALAGPRTVVQRLTVSPKLAAQDANGHEEPEVLDDVDHLVEGAEPEVPRHRGPRKPAPTPDILEVDLTSEVSLADFAAKHKPDSHRQRYLVAAAWFKLHRKTDTVTASHIYTAYRHMKWPINIPDFAQPLRDLKFNKLVGQPEKGVYEINHIGLQEVANLGAG